ncbi:Uu.00g006430.m01.CDS01 [Anthostomella pinea]|uniref:Endo-1,5-alpha-L-arabinanase A n=1 Tax=Anthostomella pinea TaxID=933095 RepID=A0AAI8YJ44_9PEZI|nr:Uu.00g006430.m01.CDS01 [Anthostomella pinea]
MRSLVLSALVGSVPIAANYIPRPASKVQRQATDVFEGYAFAYFTGDTTAGENIYFAASNGNDALDWIELNGGKPVLTSSMGTGGLRDPFIMRSVEGDTFYILATDLSIGSGTSWDDAVRTGSRYLEIWESSDLVTWSDQRHVLVSPETAGMTWAPEAYYDDELGTYVVYWASALYDESDTNHTGDTYDKMLYATTDDFTTFSEPQTWQDAGSARIDSTVLEVDGVYYRFTKDEGASTGCTDIIEESSTYLTATLDSWTQIATCIGANAGTGAVEGPSIFKSNPDDVNGDKYYLFVDEYTDRGYIPLESTSISSPDWQISSSYTLPTSPRHGTVMPIMAAELLAFTAAWTASGSAAKRSTQKDKRDSPVLAGYYADPNIAVFGDTFYIYPTTDGIPDWGGNVFYTWKSTDLQTWTRSDEPFLTLNETAGNVPWATGNAWAPTIIDRYGSYYFYFSGQNPTYDWKTIGVAVADSPEGPFTAQDEAMILNNEALTTNQAIDPATFLDPATGKYYLCWGNGVALMAELGDDMISIKEDTLIAPEGLTDFREGSFMNYRDGLYHMTYSIDDTRSEDYRVGYATASSATGPFTYQGVILQKDESQGILATGHNSIINLPGTDDWYIAYHRFAIPNGNGTMREVTIDVLNFDADTGLIQEVIPTLESVAPVSL